MGDEVAAFLFVGLIILPALVGAVIAVMVFLDETKLETLIVARHPDRSSEEGRPTEKQMRKAS